MIGPSALLAAQIQTTRAQYRILVHGFGRSSGPFELTMADDGTACSGAVSCLAAQISAIPTAGQFGLLALFLMLTGAGLYRLLRG